MEATIHCAEWLALVGGPAKGEERLRYAVLFSLVSDLVASVDCSSGINSHFLVQLPLLVLIGSRAFCLVKRVLIPSLSLCVQALGLAYSRK